MHKKILSLIIVVLFIVTVFNSSIVAKEDINRMTMITDFINARKKFEKLDVDSVQNCIVTNEYNKLLSFMGKDAKIVKNAHINATGIGYHFGKPIYYLGIKHPFPRIKRLGFPFGLFHQWIIFAKYNDENSSTYIEPESGEPFYINGSHSILVGIWFIPPVWRTKTYQKFLKNFNINLTIPWSIDKWAGMPFTPWGLYKSYKYIPFPIPWGVIEGLIMILIWPFRIQTSFIGLFEPIDFYGMTPFVIYTTP